MNERLIWIWDNIVERAILWWEIHVKGYRALPTSSDDDPEAT